VISLSLRSRFPPYSHSSPYPYSSFPPFRLFERLKNKTKKPSRVFATSPPHPAPTWVVTIPPSEDDVYESSPSLVDVTLPRCSPSPVIAITPSTPSKRKMSPHLVTNLKETIICKVSKSIYAFCFFLPLSCFYLHFQLPILLSCSPPSPLSFAPPSRCLRSLAPLSPDPCSPLRPPLFQMSNIFLFLTPPPSLSYSVSLDDRKIDLVLFLKSFCCLQKSLPRSLYIAIISCISNQRFVVYLVERGRPFDVDKRLQ